MKIEIPEGRLSPELLRKTIEIYASVIAIILYENEANIEMFIEKLKEKWLMQKAR